MKIAIILVNYNGKKYNEACIDSILQSQDTYDKYILFVDNASADDSVATLEKKYGLNGQAKAIGDYTWVEIMKLDDNYGFAVANNRGIDRAKQLQTDYVLLLNNDTEIAPDMIQQLVACADRHSGSMIIPKIYYSDDRKRIWSAGGSVSGIVKKVSHDGLDQIDNGQFEEEKETQFATGCCLLIPMSAIEKAGVLDERFFLYYEDTEYSFRLRKKGVAIYYCPKAYMYHKVGASSKGADSPLCAYYISRNWLLCNREHLGKRYPLFLVYYIVNRTACCLLWLLQGKPQLVKAAIRGIGDYCHRKFGKTEYYG